MNLLELYSTTFGYKGIPHVGLKQSAYVPEGSKLSEIEIVKAFGEDSTGSFTRTSSTLGTPFFMPCKIDGFQLPNEPIVTLKKTKTIIETPIDGNEGTFKEHYSGGDWNITIKGLCIMDDDTDEYPEEQVRALRKIIEKKTGLDVVCRLLSYFNINHLSIYDCDFPAIEGAPGIQPYELQCKSDKYFDLELLEGND
jgi:hypothetical protein